MRKAALAAAVVLLLSGCTGGEHGREPENTVLAQVLGIDRMGDVYFLTAAGLNGKGETVIQTVEGETLEEVFMDMPGSGEDWISLKNVTHILLGDAVAPEETLAFILNDGGMSWRARVWYIPIAGAAMKEEQDGGYGRLTVLEEAGEEKGSVLDVLVGLKEDGEAAVPALMRRKGKLEVSGVLYYGTGRVR